MKTLASTGDKERSTAASVTPGCTCPKSPARPNINDLLPEVRCGKALSGCPLVHPIGTPTARGEAEWGLAMRAPSFALMLLRGVGLQLLGLTMVFPGMDSPTQLPRELRGDLLELDFDTSACRSQSQVVDLVVLNFVEGHTIDQPVEATSGTFSPDADNGAERGDAERSLKSATMARATQILGKRQAFAQSPLR